MLQLLLSTPPGPWRRGSDGPSKDKDEGGSVEVERTGDDDRGDVDGDCGGDGSVGSACNGHAGPEDDERGIG